MKRRALPEPLTHATFTPATAFTFGVSKRRLRAHDLDNRVWGVRTTGTPKTLEHRCQLFAARLGPHTFFSHSTAALLYSVPLPWQLETRQDVHVSVQYPSRAPHAKGIRGHSLSVANHEIVRRHGLRLTCPERTWWDLAAMLDIFDLVAAGDHLVRRRAPLTTIAKLAAECASHRGGRGFVVANAALALLNTLSESRPESQLRVVMAFGGLPEPLINHSLVHTEDGTIVRPDFEFTDYKTLVEYQGDYHRLTKAQWRKDMTRRSRLEAAGWTVIEINADDLRDHAELVARITSVLRRHGWSG
jgi:Protein of unknown function (DUF559)